MTAPKQLPVQVSAAHRGWDARVVYDPYFTATWKLTSPAGVVRFVKVAWDDDEMYPTLVGERDRMLWAQKRLTVPVVLDYGHNGDIEWLLTEGLPGIDATHLTDDPKSVVPILAQGLRAIHESRADDCPFDFRLDAALEHCRRRVAGEEVPESRGDFHEEFSHLTPATALAWLSENRPDSEDVVLCHGDYCFPNILIEDGRAVGYIDLGEMGLADRWCDLAVATWSCDWNVGPGYQDLFYEAYGIEPNKERITYYRLLYDLAS